MSLINVGTNVCVADVGGIETVTVTGKTAATFSAVFRKNHAAAAIIATGGGHEQRYTIGLDYWLDARSVVKVAYEFDQVANGQGMPAFMMQFGIGF